MKVTAIEKTSSKEIMGIVYEGYQNHMNFTHILDSNDERIKLINDKERIKEFLERKYTLVVQEEMTSQAMIGQKTIEGCCYKPEEYTFEIAYMSDGTCFEETINNLEEVMKKTNIKRNEKSKKRSFQSLCIL